MQEGRRSVLCEFLAGAASRDIFNGVPRVDAVALRSLREAKRRELGLSDSDCLVLGVGRLVEQKRPFLFLRTAKELHDGSRYEISLGREMASLAEEWQRAIAREKLEDVIYCAGWQADVLPYLLAGDLLLHVAEFEGLPLAVIEAMAAGLTCAVTKRPFVRDPLLQ